MKMMLDNWDILLGVGSILFIAGFIWLGYRNGMKVRVNDHDTNSNRNMN